MVSLPEWLDHFASVCTCFGNNREETRSGNAIASPFAMAYGTSQCLLLGYQLVTVSRAALARTFGKCLTSLPAIVMTCELSSDNRKVDHHIPQVTLRQSDHFEVFKSVTKQGTGVN